MNLAHLFLLQSELDQHIETKHQRKEGESRQLEKILSLLVELAELANETRCFKYWSNKPASEKEVILEEFSDGIHFLLSLGLENGVEEISIRPIGSDTLTEHFIGLFNCFSVLGISYSRELYSSAWSAYLGLGAMLGFSWQDIESAYIAKNEKNHARQDGGY